jgi:S1-C subfamily serine protease
VATGEHEKENDHDDKSPAPLPAHERGWRHPSEIGHEAWMSSEPPLRIGRGLSATTGAIGVMIAFAVLWTMMPTEAGRSAVVSVRSTLATSNSSVVSNSLRLPTDTAATSTIAPTTAAPSTVVASTVAPTPPMPTYSVQQTTTLADGAVAIAVSDSSLIITTAYAVQADSNVELLLSDGTTAHAQVLFVDHDSGLAVLTTDTPPDYLAFTVAEIAPGDELTLVGATTYTFTIGLDGTFDQEFIYDDSVREGTPVTNQDGDLVGLCSNSGAEHFVALGDFAVVQRALAGWAGLHEGDVIVAINGRPVADDATFVDALAGLMPGDLVRLTVRYASGDEATLEIQLGTG